MKSGHSIIFAVYLVLGLYVLNSALSFISLPEIFMSIDKWILVISGALLILGGINFLRLKKLKGY